MTYVKENVKDEEKLYVLKCLKKKLKEPARHRRYYESNLYTKLPYKEMVDLDFNIKKTKVIIESLIDEKYISRNTLGSSLFDTSFFYFIPEDAVQILEKKVASKAQIKKKKNIEPVKEVNPTPNIDQIKTWSIEILSIVMTLGLSVYELAAYTAFLYFMDKDGRCSTIRRLVLYKCPMSEEQYKKVKKSLSRPRKRLDGCSLITLGDQRKFNGNYLQEDLVVNDISKCNAIKIFKLKGCK